MYANDVIGIFLQDACSPLFFCKPSYIIRWRNEYSKLVCMRQVGVDEGQISQKSL